MLPDWLPAAAGRLRRVTLPLLLVLCLGGVLKGWVYETQLHLISQLPVPAVALDQTSQQAAAAFPNVPNAVPVLTFHDVRSTAGPYAVQPRTFAQQVAALKKAGFRTVRLQDVEDLVAGRPVRLPAKPLLLTFDDGFASTWRAVDPVLARNGYNAVAFIITGRVLPGYRVSSVLDEEEIRQMQRSGRWEFGGHTDALHYRGPTATDGAEPALVNRLVLPGGASESLDQWRKRVDADLTRSQAAMVRLTGRTASAFAFPYGASDRPVNDPAIPLEINRLLVAHGYKVAFNAENAAGATADLQLAATQPLLDPLRLPRLGVGSGERPQDVLAELASVVPDPMPTSIAGLHWHAQGGTCSPGASGSLQLRSRTYVDCTSDAQAMTWRNYSLEVRLDGLSSSCTGMVSVRESHNVLHRGRLEVAIGASRVSIRSFEGNTHRLLWSGVLPPAARSSAQRLQLSALDDRLSLSVDKIHLASVPTGNNAWGAPSFAAACHGGDPLRITAPALRPLSGNSPAHPEGN